MRVGPDGFINVKGYYRGKNILITGCTGFVGKVLLEKLLRSCPDSGTLYVMARLKRKQDPMKRVLDILKSPCFKELKKIYGGEREFLKFAKSKIVPVAGDLI